VTPPAGAEIDRLVETAVFGADAAAKGTARWTLRRLAAEAGIRPASIHALYMAMGRGDAGGFTVPAINVRAMAYDTARAVVRAAKALDAGAFIFEISRSEIEYTAQPPHEYAAVVLGAALRERFAGPIFLQGDHVQVAAKRYRGPDRERELADLRGLIGREIDAGFFNIDIDTSTLVDLDQRTLADQQALNASLAAGFTAFIRQREPRGITISVGGEIGEVGGRNSTVDELRAFMDGYTAALRSSGREYAGVSKISVQTGTAHGGFVNPDGTVRMDVSIDLHALDALSRAARTEYGLAGVVQHGASTLPADAFEAFPRAGACEIHLATSFQTIVLEHPQFPRDLRDAIDAWVTTHAAGDRAPGDTDEQFIYKARKKALGAFKSRMWTIDAARRDAIAAALEAQFTMLMTRLNIVGTAAAVARFVDALPAAAIDRDREIAAAC
jgi:fructose/tagatose bisphosphate aldolase